MAIERYRIDIEGLVQGIGFRPFVYRLAQQQALDGWVRNDCGGVRIEVQGDSAAVRNFIRSLAAQKPRQAKIHNLRSSPIATRREAGFVIRRGGLSGDSSAIVLPDLAPCRECLAEIGDANNRRYRYPFTHCTHCGPRFSIIETLPYERGNTTMREFVLCDDCRREYQDPADRRFHAEAIACPRCGPQLELHGDTASCLGEQALQRALDILRDGGIVALKSVGGFQLLTDAANHDAIARLRERKQRPTKPLALVYPDLPSLLRDCHLSTLERRLLLSPERPIVLLKATEQPTVADNVAPGNPNLGVMLPCSPLHHLLLGEMRRPLVATSGNRGGEPICYRNDSAIERLGEIADAFLWHDRPIARPLDDSVLRVIDHHAVLLRRARGYAPLPLTLEQPLTPMLAVGGHLKNTVALARGHNIYLSQHLGDLDSPASLTAFRQAIDDLRNFYRSDPAMLIHDRHPNYASTLWAERQERTRLAVPHHIAHFFAAMAERQHRQAALGVSWDGTGYSGDGVVRGGEFFHWEGHGEPQHFASLRPFPLPGGEQAIREPRRCMLGLLYELFEEQAFNQVPELYQDIRPSDRDNLLRLLQLRLNTPSCTSVGRLFDAVSALLGLAERNDFEGQAAMALEFAADDDSAAYPFQCLRNRNQWLLDWGPMLTTLLQDRQQGVRPARIAARFHNTLAQMILTMTEKAGGLPVFLSGGVFQNKRLTETTTALLRKHGYRVFSHSQVPPNDGGIALGQIYFAHCMEPRHVSGNSWQS